MNAPATGDESLVLSYLALRKAIGIIGTALPFVLVIGKILLQGSGLEPSISDYYYTAMRNVFVGSLWAIGVFMLSYHGYEKRDDVAGDVACFSAIGVSLFPTTPAVATKAQETIGMVHYGCAMVFFLTLAYFCLFLFTKTDATKTMTRRKRQRNGVYVACGIAMLACIAGIAIYKFFLQDTALKALDPVFCLETVAVLAFGFSWLVKGEALLKDEA